MDSDGSGWIPMDGWTPWAPFPGTAPPAAPGAEQLSTRPVKIPLKVKG